MIKPLSFFAATSSMDDPLFFNAIIFITQADSNGATGFVLNKIFPRKLNELTQFISSPPFPLYAGGPVAETELFFLHRRPDVIADGVHLGNSIYLGGNFDQAIAAINSSAISETDIKIFIGYCGWDAGELEAEIAGKSWEQRDLEDVFVQTGE